MMTTPEAPGASGLVEGVLRQLHQRIEERSVMGLRLTAESYNYTYDDVRWALEAALSALPSAGWQAIDLATERAARQQKESA